MTVAMGSGSKRATTSQDRDFAKRVATLEHRQSLGAAAYFESASADQVEAVSLVTLTHNDVAGPRVASFQLPGQRPDRVVRQTGERRGPLEGLIQAQQVQPTAEASSDSRNGGLGAIHVRAVEREGFYWSHAADGGQTSLIGQQRAFAETLARSEDRQPHVLTDQVRSLDDHHPLREHVPVVAGITLADDRFTRVERDRPQESREPLLLIRCQGIEKRDPPEDLEWIGRRHYESDPRSQTGPLRGRDFGTISRMGPLWGNDLSWRSM